MRMLAGVCFLMCCLAMVACRDTEATGKYFEISGRAFSFNYRVATARYVVTLRPVQPMQQGQVVVATFENPAGGDPIVVEQKVWPQLDKVAVDSPPLQCVVKDRPYKVSLVVNSAEGKALQKLETTVISSLDQTVLPDRALVVGPFYDRNPDLNPDGTLKAGKGEGMQCPKA